MKKNSAAVSIPFRVACKWERAIVSECVCVFVCVRALGNKRGYKA